MERTPRAALRDIGLIGTDDTSARLQIAAILDSVPRGLEDPEVRPSVHSAACQHCAELGLSTSVEWTGGLGEEAVTDMRDHLREVHVPLSVLVAFTDKGTHFQIGND